MTANATIALIGSSLFIFDDDKSVAFRVPISAAISQVCLRMQSCETEKGKPNPFSSALVNTGDKAVFCIC
jgi:hypothetical protein